MLAGTTLSELQACGHEVRWARSAQTAVDAIDTEEPDVMILELQLGIHNGIELLYEIRSYPEWQNIPVVIYTVNRRATDDTFDTTLQQLGVQAVYYKPSITPKQLRLKLNQLYAA